MLKSSSTADFFYRPKSRNYSKVDATGNDKFLLVHQEVWQQRLLSRYGSDLVLIDATYKTTKYALPLFFVSVHTNAGYKVVAEFICENENAESIAEALRIIKSWNVGWNPIYFMVDYSLAEINAIGEVFPNAAVYICDFHRKQAWNRWVRSSKNNLNSKEQQVLTDLLQRVAYSRTASSYNTALENLRKSSVYKSKKNVQDYVENIWAACAERWAQAFPKQQAVNIVNTNNGVEAQNKHFKYDYLPRSVDKSAYGITMLLVESFIPDILRNRPSHFIKHCMKSRFVAGEYR